MKKLLVLVLGLAACGGNPASPDRETQIPRVDGTYQGPLTTFRVDGVNYPGVSMRITVAQAGSQVTINGAFLVQGETFPIPAITGTLSATGTLSEGPTSGDFGECGLGSNGYASLTFSGSSAVFTLNANTQWCGAMSLSGTLRK